jgi:D-glycero-D-manno-heptose 1,7-bisphosphate phosphatase
MKLLVLDRDGVINQDSDAFVKSVAEWVPIPGSLEAIARLSQAGWKIAVATNQSGLARGLFDIEVLSDMHFVMQQRVMDLGGHIDLIVHCPHGPDDNCDCRKPKAGLFRSIAKHFNMPDLDGVPVVGDSLRDLQAGVSLGCTPYLVKTGKGLQTMEKPLPEGTQLFENLAAVANHLLQDAS